MNSFCEGTVCCYFVKFVACFRVDFLNQLENLPKCSPESRRFEFHLGCFQVTHSKN